MSMLIMTCVVVSMTFFPPTPGTAKGIGEDELRALYLFNFSSFVRWPEDSFDSASSGLRYCVLGKGAVNLSLKQLVQGEMVGGHPLEYRVIRPDESAEGCHILYLNRDPGRKLSEIARELVGRPVLTVSDTRKSVDDGVMIALVRSGSRVRPVVNLKVVKQSGIHLSAKLLQLSTVIDGR